MKNERLIYLFNRYAQQQQTDAEMAELQHLLADEQQEDAVKAVIDEHFVHQAPSYKMKAGVSDDILATILRTGVEKPAAPLRPVRAVRSNYKWWAAAAAIVAVCGTGLYFWQQQSGPKQQVAINKVDVPPGGQKAVLKLADGSEIVLDSTGRRTINLADASIQQHNGQLAYTASADGRQTSYNVLSIPRGGQFQLVLSDGTKVWLNAASSLRYPTAFQGKEREVELTGEAYFEVAQQASQPFKVKVNNATVTVLGTSFNIMAYADEGHMNTTLVDGAVMVSGGAAKETLHPGQEAVWNHTAGTLAVQQANIDKVIAWKSGFFELDNTDLPTIMRQLARWYNIEVIDQSKGTTASLFGGRISRDVNLADVLHVLERYGVRFSVDGNKVTILP